ncbi:MAG: hypothetical protein ACREEB_01340 [Caulobacteraceae bacterium]
MKVAILLVPFGLFFAVANWIAQTSGEIGLNFGGGTIRKADSPRLFLAAMVGRWVLVAVTWGLAVLAIFTQ